MSLVSSFDNIFQKVGKSLTTDQKTRSFIAKNAKRQARYGLAAKGSSKSTAAQAYTKAVAKRQAQLGRRAIVGGAATAVGIGSMGSNKKSYYNPKPQTMSPQGSGRYA